jgi:hypothetical protein
MDAGAKSTGRAHDATLQAARKDSADTSSK